MKEDIQHQELKQAIYGCSIELKLPAFRKHYLEFAQQAAKQNQSYEQYLLQLMEEETAQRVIRRREQRIRRAQFPYKKFLQDIQLEELPKDGQQKFQQLQRLDFISQGQNIIFSGNPGTGKTHMAIGLGIKACQQDFTVMFTTIPRLITQINEARSERKLRLLEARFENYDLVICDEFGYVSFDKQAAEILFTHLSLRAGRKATIITTNLAFNRWKEIFGDEILTAAMVDRLTHRAILVDMNGQSFRIKETQQLSSL
ncbi:MAG: IS21-like element helper ATPase IstB [Bacteroidota bacterium]